MNREQYHELRRSARIALRAADHAPYRLVSERSEITNALHRDYGSALTMILLGPTQKRGTSGPIFNSVTAIQKRIRRLVWRLDRFAGLMAMGGNFARVAAPREIDAIRREFPKLQSVRPKPERTQPVAKATQLEEAR